MSSLIRMRLLSRVILHGVVLVGVSAAAFLSASFFLMRSATEHDRATMGTWVGAHACDRVEHSENPAREIATLPFPVVVFMEDGRKLSSGGSDIDPLAPNEVSHLPDGIAVEIRNHLAFRCSVDSNRYVVESGPGPPLPDRRFTILVAAIVVLVSVGSIPLARSLVRPLRELASVADTFGRGDLSARARVERTDEIGDLAKAFNTMAEGLNAHLLAEKELLANLSHELRTPLARIRVVLETASEDPTRANALLQEIARDLGDLERLTEDVLATIRLDFSGAGRGPHVTLRLERISMVPLLKDAVARCVEANPDREIELQVRDTLPWIHGDPSLLMRLFTNVLDNARKYSRGLVQVRARRADESVVIEFEDQGIGIEREDLQRIFDPFFRSDRSRRRTSGGTGLGLTLCRRIVDAHGGRIIAESEPGVGTTVTIHLPSLR